MRQYADLRLGLAGACVIALAERHTHWPGLSSGE
jgi:hypothetical protein